MSSRIREGVFRLARAGIAWSAAGQLLIVLRGERELAAFPLIDDTFYSWTVASQIASGHGATFDGVIPTNGFQPLHVLALVPAFWLAKGIRSDAVPMLMAFALVVSFATAYCVWRLCRAVAGRDASLLAVTLWMLSPAIAMQMLNGLETAPATALVAVCGLAYLRAASAPRPMSLGHAAAIGLLLGLTILVRIDGAILAVVIGLAYLWAHRARLGAAARALAVCALAALLVCGGWFLQGWLRFGSPLPNSGQAVRFLAFFLGRQGLALPMALPDPVIPPAYYLFNAQLTLGTIGNFLPWFATSDPLSAQSLVVGCVLVALLVAATVRAMWRRPTQPSAVVLSMLLIHAVALAGAYCGYIFGQWYYSRYYAPLSVLLAVGAAAGFKTLGLAAKRKGGFLRFALPLVATVAIVSSAWMFFMVLKDAVANANDSPRYDAAMWLNRSTSRDATIGAFQAGTIGYFTRRRVVNLDGVVNPDALRALRTRRFEDYLARNRIGLIVDNRWQLQAAFCDAGYPLVEFSHLRPVHAPALTAVAFEPRAAESADESRSITFAWLCGDSPPDP